MFLDLNEANDFRSTKDYYYSYRIYKLNIIIITSSCNNSRVILIWISHIHNYWIGYQASAIVKFSILTAKNFVVSFNVALFAAVFFSSIFTLQFIMPYEWISGCRYILLLSLHCIFSQGRFVYEQKNSKWLYIRLLMFVTQITITESVRLIFQTLCQF